MSITVRDDSNAGQFTIFDDDAPAGFAQYRLRKDIVAFLHTEIDPAFKGRGLGGRLVRDALSTVRGRGLVVMPYCPFVRSYIASHPEFLDLVPAHARDLFDLG